jgi:hypothetical protein
VAVSESEMAKRAKALGAVVVMAGLGLAFAGARVGQARSAISELLLWVPPDMDPSERARHMTDAASRILTTVHVASPVFAGTFLLVFLALVFTGVSGFGRRLAAVGALLFALSSAAAAASNLQLYSEGYHCGVPCLHEALLRAQRWAMLGKAGVLAGAALCWVILLARAYADANRAEAASRRALLVSTLLLLLGGTAFAATRAHAWDAQHPMPPDAANANTHACLTDEARLAQLPPARPDCVSLEGPIVELEPRGIVLDGSVVSTPEELRSQLKAKRELWQMLNPDARPFPGLILFAAPRTATTRELLPWLAAAERAGFPKLGIYLQAPPQRFASKTVGTITKLRCCSAVWNLDASATKSLTAWQTWGELSAAPSSPDRALVLR